MIHKIVPATPTEGMEVAGIRQGPMFRQPGTGKHISIDTGHARGIYTAMTAAAPDVSEELVERAARSICFSAVCRDMYEGGVLACDPQMITMQVDQKWSDYADDARAVIAAIEGK